MTDLNQPRAGDIYAEDASGEGHIIPNLSIAPYTPTTEEVRNRYCSEVFEEDEAEFDRWLAEVKAQAWDDCAQEAYDRGMLHDINFEDIKALNPYRQGEEQNV